MVTSAEELYYRRYLNDVANGAQGYQGSGAGLITSFSADLKTTDSQNPNVLNLPGKDWIFAVCSTKTTQNPICLPGYLIGTSSIDGQNCLAWQPRGPSNPQQNLPGYLIPVITFQSLYGQSQFSQATMVQVASTGSSRLSCGLGVMLVPANDGDLLGYEFYNDTDATTSWWLDRREVNSVHLAIGGAGSISNGDIFSLSADLSVGGEVTLKVLRNRNLLTQYTDNSASRIVIGSPELICDFQ